MSTGKPSTSTETRDNTWRDMPDWLREYYRGLTEQATESDVRGNFLREMYSGIGSGGPELERRLAEAVPPREGDATAGGGASPGAVPPHDMPPGRTIRSLEHNPALLERLEGNPAFIQNNLRDLQSQIDAFKAAPAAPAPAPAPGAGGPTPGPPVAAAQGPNLEMIQRLIAAQGIQ